MGCRYGVQEGTIVKVSCLSDNAAPAAESPSAPEAKVSLMPSICVLQHMWRHSGCTAKFLCRAHFLVCLR